MLLLLDDARDAAQVRPLLPGGGDCGVLVTTRGRLADLEGAHFVHLDVLDEAEADLLLGRVAGRDRVAEDRAATRRVLAACGGLPLALRIAGARVAAWPERGLAQLADRLTDERGRLDQLAVGDLEIRAGLALTDRALPAEARRAFRLLGALDVPATPVWVLPALLDRPEATAAELLDQLLEVHLVQTTTGADGGPRVRLHDLVRLYAREQAEDATEVRAAVGRAAGAWLGLADAAEPGLSGGFTRTVIGSAPRWPTPPATVAAARDRPDAWFGAERGALVALVRSCLDHRHDELAWDLAGVCVRFLELRGHYDDLAGVVELGLTAARRVRHDRAEAFLLRAQGELHADLDRYDRAADCLERAVAASRAAEDDRNQAWSLRALSTVLRVQGSADAARDRLHTAIALFERVEDLTGIGECHYGLGAIAREHGRWVEAQHHYAVALAIFRGLEDPFNESLVAMSAARVHQILGDLPRAAEDLQRALELSRAVDHPGGIAWACSYLGDVWLTDRPDAAEPLLDQALALSRRIGDRYCEAVTLHTLGRLRLGTGDQVAAERLLRSSMVLADACDLPLHRGRSLITLGDSQLLRGAVTEAVGSWRAAHELLSAYGFPEAADAEHRLLARR